MTRQIPGRQTAAGDAAPGLRPQELHKGTHVPDRSRRRVNKRWGAGCHNGSPSVAGAHCENPQPCPPARRRSRSARTTGRRREYCRVAGRASARRAQVGFCALNLGDGAINVEQRDQRVHLEPRWIVGAEIVQPIIECAPGRARAVLADVVRSG